MNTNLQKKAEKKEEKGNKEYAGQINNYTVIDSNLTTSIITSNVNILNTPVKRLRLSEWIKKQNPTVYSLQEMHFKHKDINRKTNRTRYTMLTLVKKKLK